MMITFSTPRALGNTLRRLWAALTARPTPSPYDAPVFREWLAAQREPFTLTDAAQAAGFASADLTPENRMRTGAALKRLGFHQVQRPGSNRRYWYAPPGLVLEVPSRQAGYYIPDLTGFFIGLLVVGVLLGALLTIGVPWVWSLIKPWLHEVTR
jgi:hypothetical protein